MKALTKIEEKIYAQCQGKCESCYYEGGCKLQKKLKKEVKE